MTVLNKIDNYLNEIGIRYKEIVDSLNDKELFMLGLFMGLKPSYRQRELERMMDGDILKPKYKVDVKDFDKFKKTLISKGLLTKTGGVKNKDRDEILTHWSKRTGGRLPSQFHQWALK